MLSSRSGVVRIMSGRLVAFLVALRCVGWLSSGRGAVFLMSGRFPVILSGSVGVSVGSDGVRCCPPYRQPCRLLMPSSCREGAAVILSGSVAVALRLVADWLPIGRGVLLMPSSCRGWDVRIMAGQPLKTSAYIIQPFFTVKDAKRHVVWRLVPRLFQQRSVLIQKWGKVIFSKLAISEGATKSANLPTIVKNKQLFFSFYGVRSRVLTFQSVRF